MNAELSQIEIVDFKTIFDSLVNTLKVRYGVTVYIGPVPGPFIGQLDGKDIWIDFEQNPGNAVFTLAHPFGHTVQWNIDKGLRELALNDVPVIERDFPRIYKYEREASQYGLALLQEVGAGELAAWLTNCFGSDWKFLKHCYLTGEKVRFALADANTEPLLEALPIPAFTPQRWAIRGAF
ncbi:MAG: hypothetical protein JWM68_5482 [Verrucomicrobiales bacterium]|nr:hypothetical protein [Verrucomicrobiales bacterium]